MRVDFVEHRDMRLDLALFDQPGQVRRRAVGAVGGKVLWLQPEALGGAVEHGARSTHLGWRMARFASTSRMIALVSIS